MNLKLKFKTPENINDINIFEKFLNIYNKIIQCEQQFFIIPNNILQNRKQLCSKLEDKKLINISRHAYPWIHRTKHSINI